MVDSVRVPPGRFGEELKPVIADALQAKLEGRVDRDLGVYVAVTDVYRIGEGKIVPGDGGVYYEVEFDAVSFLPEVNEMSEGEIVEIVEFGAFVGVGPLDALLHVSQIADEYISYDEKQSRLVGKEGGIALSEGDAVRTRIVTVSLNERNPRESKIGMTMRQPALGKVEEVYRSEKMAERRAEYLRLMEEERAAEEAAKAEAEEARAAERVECLECGELYKQITGSHLSTHDMTVEEYREKHGEDVALRAVA
ncbi:MAG: DNA-directed RNA polymerase subunit E' [Methanonatronarchaeales archaeon]|nr:DNA-directed RNA polymerase subunit E' [Methanonatronarchaeales archaeon]